MDTIFPDSKVGYRAITSAWAHHIFYIFIILMESLIAFFGLKAAYHFYLYRDAETEIFIQQKNNAYIAVAIGVLLWFISFSIVGAEWFAMWQSAEWNAVQAANRLIILDAILYALILKVE